MPKKNWHQVEHEFMAQKGFTQVAHIADHSALGECTCSFDGLVVTVPPFAIQGLTYAGGSISVPPSGTWYIGVEIFSGVLRVLPRLGHRGWVPVARVISNETKISDIKQIPPKVPASRIPRTMQKLLDGQAVNIVVMGSSLTASGGAATDWPGMVFGSGSTDKYKLPGTINASFIGVGGSPNQYQLAQLGYGSTHTGGAIGDSGWPGVFTTLSAPNGRSGFFSNTDLVVIGCLANGGDFRLQIIEPMIRRLRKQNIEVIIITDNPQNPTNSYDTLSQAALYTDAPTIFRVADLYGVEVADTAAYVFESHLRNGGTGIYSDTIHQASGLPNGPSSLIPANGHEAYARAVRSIFHAGVTVYPSQTQNVSYDFSTGLNSWYAYSAANISVSGSNLVVTKNQSASNQWGAMVALPRAVSVGDTVVVTGTSSFSGFSPSIGLQKVLSGGGWASNSPTFSNGSFSVTLTVSAATNTPQLLIFGNWDAAPLNTQLTISNLSMTITTQAQTISYDWMPNREIEIKPLPAPRVVRLENAG